MGTSAKTIASGLLEMKRRPPIKLGERFNMLEVVEITNLRRNKKRLYRCKCECGNYVHVTSSNLRNAHVKSCGCMRRERMKTIAFKHGDSGSKTYTFWAGIKAKCYNPKNIEYKKFGALGIRVCPEWINSYATFREDMGECPATHKLARHDKTADFSKGNCYWVIKKCYTKGNQK